MAPPHFFLRVLLLLPLLSSLPAVLSAPLCNANEKRVLLQLKESLGNPNIVFSWTPDTDCCKDDWVGIKCDPDTGRVTSLEVSFTNASGVIPPSIGDLPYLTVLGLRKSSNLTGPIPAEISKLTNLRELWLDMNRLTGPVPDFLGRMAKLDYINLSLNKLSGFIPPSLGDLPGLQGLFLDGNRLTGTIPDSLGRLRHPTGLYIHLEHNHLTGPVPRSFGNLNISHIDLSRNGLTGDPSVLFRAADRVTSIFPTVCNLSRNRFKSDLSIAEFSTKLGVLDLSHNRIYGRIPAQLGKLEGLQSIDLSYNQLCGEIPQGGRLQNFIKDVFIHNKCLCGEPLPPCK